MTRSPRRGRVGQQQPRLYSEPESVGGIGGEVVDFMRQIGRPLDPWQELIVEAAFRRHEDGLWAASDVVLLVPRQNGKGAVSEAWELGGMFLLREPVTLHSAHEFKTSTVAFRRLMELIDGSDWLTRRVQSVSKSKGDESITLTRSAGGARLQFVARTGGAGRGFTAGRLCFDEAYALTSAQYAAQTPTLATIPDPQILYTSTPPDEDIGPMPEDAMLPAMRKLGKQGDSRTLYAEWSPARGHDPEDVDEWYRCNPALGIRISEGFLAKQLKAFKAAGSIAKFSTEHLGDWPLGSDEQWLVISEADWAAALDPESRIQGARAMSLDVSPDRSGWAIGVAGRRADGLRHVEVAAHGPGTAGAVERAQQLDRKWRPTCWMVDATGATGSLIPDLEAAGITVTRMTAQDAAAAYGQMYDGIAGAFPDEPGVPSPRDVRHIGQGPLTAAVAGALKRKVSASTAWGRIGVGVFLSPVVSTSAALLGFARNPGRSSAPVAAPSAGVLANAGNMFRPGQRLRI